MCDVYSFLIIRSYIISYTEEVVVVIVVLKGVLQE